MPAEYGGHVELNVDWAYLLPRRMKFVQTKVMTAKPKLAIAEFCELKKQFLADVVAMVEIKEIPPELTLNRDQTGIKIVPSSSWTMEQQGTKHVDLVGVGDK